MATATLPSSAPSPISIDTQHEDLVHDAQMDYYGAKLATCSSDRTIKIYNVFESSYELAATLQGHEGPVWQVSWAHPKFGVMLASCSFDGSVLIHQQGSNGQWTLLHAARRLHESSINGVAFCPHEYGLMLAAASSDGKVSILRHEATSNAWVVDKLDDCPMGVNAVSWAPYGAYVGDDRPRLVTAGCDNQIRFWVCDQGVWQDTVVPTLHSDWVRDVAWAPVLLPNHNMVASCSEDRTVLIWKQTKADGEWKATVLESFENPVWRVSWSITGHLLAVSSGDSDVTLWKSVGEDEWTKVSSVEEQEGPGQAN
jgi:protein transport protein SEC13